MEMKAEYSYGSYKISEIRLLRKNLGDSPARVLHVLRKLYPQSRYKDMNFRAFLVGHPEDAIVEWRLSEQTEIDFLEEQFSWANARLEICEINIALLSENEYVPTYRLKDSLRFDDYSRFSSSELSRMQEYCFDIWAKENHLDEAYRLFIFPALSPSETIRVWLRGEKAYGIYKLARQGFCIKAPAREMHFEIEAETWKTFSMFMEKFWQAESWRTVHDVNMGILDGFSLDFEGWRNGEYKALGDFSPTSEESISLEAEEMFRSLVPKWGIEDGWKILAP